MHPHNPYAAPDAALPDASPDAAPIDQLATLFAPSGVKLALLCATSFGWYALYWFYRNWQAICLISDRRRISPVWRSVFSLICIFACFRALDRVTGPHPQGALGWGWPALAYVGLSLLWVSPSPLALLGLFAWLPLLASNRRLIRFKRARGLPARVQERFTGWTWAWLVIAGPPALLVLSNVVVSTVMVLARSV